MIALKTSHADRVLAVASDRSASGRSAIAASWVRSVHRYGLNPRDGLAPRRLGPAEFIRARESIQTLLAVARPTLDTLFQSVGGAGCCVVFSDRNGVTIDRRGAPADDETFQRLGLWTGAVWSEESEGTNGIGTCLAEERPVTIHRDQHFHTRNIGLSCSVAPIHDHEGRLAAALDVSSCRADVTEMFGTLIATAVLDAARRIEAQNFRQSFPHARIMLAPDSERSMAALLAIDGDDLIIGATRAARLAYGLTDARLARPLPADTILNGGGTGGNEDLDRAERGVLQRALARSAGNISAASKALRISRSTLYRKMKRLQLDTPPGG